MVEVEPELRQNRGQEVPICQRLGVDLLQLRWVWLVWRDCLTCRFDGRAAAGACCLLLFGAAGLGGA